MPNNVVSFQAASSLKNSKVVLVEPRVYAEAQDIAEHLKNKRATIVIYNALIVNKVYVLSTF